MKTSTKLSFIAGLLVGYVLGARAGRERYEQIAAGAQKLWNSKPVQKQVDNAQGVVNKYVPEVVESSFQGLGKVASGLASKVLGGKNGNGNGNGDKAGSGKSGAGKSGGARGRSNDDAYRGDDGKPTPTGTVHNPSNL